MHGSCFRSDGFSSGWRLRYPHIMLTGIRNRILLFAVLATLLPSLVLGWMYFHQSRQMLLDNTAREMKAVASQAEREVLLWLKEQLYELRVFAGTYLLSGALEGYYRSRSAQGQVSAEVANSMSTYLSTVHAQYDHYRRLLVFDNEGHLIVQEPSDGAGAGLPPDWMQQLASGRVVRGRFIVRQDGGEAALLLGVPVASANDGLLGILAVEVGLEELRNTWHELVFSAGKRESATHLLLIDGQGMVVLDAAEKGMKAVRYSSARQKGGSLRRYRNPGGVDVMGLLLPVSGERWKVAVEKPRQRLFADVERNRNMAVLAVLGILVLVGLLAWRLARGIIVPLGQLTASANEVAEGNLDVEIPVGRRDELGFASSVFNDMVRQLRRGREHLEKLSTTDFLTRLPNRAAIVEALSGMLGRYRRYSRAFSLLMIDVDHFKAVNDRYGHVAGDEVLRHVASILREQMREVDIIGRYGGEEFVALLDETDGESALVVAERIRAEIAASGMVYRESRIDITVSIGIAEAEPGDELADSIIDRADSAMYLAKRNGRNRSELAGKARSGS